MVDQVCGITFVVVSLCPSPDLHHWMLVKLLPFCIAQGCYNASPLLLRTFRCSLFLSSNICLSYTSDGVYGDPYLQRTNSGRPNGSNGYAGPPPPLPPHQPRTTNNHSDAPPPSYDDLPPAPPARQPIYHDNHNPYRKKGMNSGTLFVLLISYLGCVRKVIHCYVLLDSRVSDFCCPEIFKSCCWLLIYFVKTSTPTTSHYRYYISLIVFLANTAFITNTVFVPDTIYLDDPYTNEVIKEGSSGDSGVSTPDPSTKPKKVIHEVIV